MITIISGTNRQFSKTLIVSQAYEEILKQSGNECQIFSLLELPVDFAFSYLSDPKTIEFDSLINKYIRPSSKLIIILPEYQGTFPGIFKLFLDGINPIDLQHKKVAMVGVSDGRSGNLRGLDQISNALNYLSVSVYPYNLPISGIEKMVNSEFKLVDEVTLKLLQKHAKGFLEF